MMTTEKQQKNTAKNEYKKSLAGKKRIIFRGNQFSQIKQMLNLSTYHNL